MNRLNRAAMKILAAVEPDPKKNQELCAALLYRRALQSFQGTILLAERGMIADALTLVRSCAETAIALGCFASDKRFIDRLIEDDANHRLTYANVILGDKYLRQPLTPEQVRNLEKVVSAVKKRYPTTRPKSINWADAAIHERMGVLYDMIYRTTSGGATHVTINALDRHLLAAKSKRPHPDLLAGKSVRQSLKALTFQPEIRDLVQCLSGATSAILHALDALGRIFPQKGIEKTMKPYAALWAQLVS